MAKLYKEMGTCMMCKERFEVIKNKQGYTSRSYCPACVKKYFKKKKE